jgi:trehalose 6-phosphate phosphatase
MALARGVPHLFDCWEQVLPRFEQAMDVRLFLDFDGTLAPLHPSPRDVKKLSGGLRSTLRRLSQKRRVHVAIVSGRRRAALHRFIGVPQVELMGLFGSEKNGDLNLSRKTIAALPRFRSRFQSGAVEYPGVFFEEKGVSFAIHFRAAPAEVQQRARAWIRKLVLLFRPNFHVIRTNNAWEIVPREVHGKGVAVRDYMKRLSARGLAIYLGDDLADEPAFLALRRGITVRVGSPAPTKAHFRLENPGEVNTFLERLEEDLS